MRKVKLLGGPCDGEEVEVEEDLHEISIYWFRGEFSPERCEKEKAKFLSVYRAKIFNEFYCVELRDFRDEP